MNSGNANKAAIHLSPALVHCAPHGIFPGGVEHGKVDVIEDTVESEFMMGACKRISIRVRPASRVDLYLPAAVKLHVNLGDEVVGGQCGGEIRVRAYG